MRYLYALSETRDAEAFEEFVQRACAKQDPTNGLYPSPYQPMCIRMAEEILSPMDLFSLNPRNDISVIFEESYTESVFTETMSMAEELHARADIGPQREKWIRTRVAFKCRGNSSRVQSDLLYQGSLTYWWEDPKRDNFAVGAVWDEWPTDLPENDRKMMIENIFLDMLEGIGMQSHVRRTEYGGAYINTRPDLVRFSREMIDPAAFSLLGITPFEKAVKMLEAIMGSVADEYVSVEFICDVRTDTHDKFRALYGSMRRSWVVEGYGRLADWVQPFAPVDSLPPDAPKEVPIYQKWDRNLESFEMGRILRTPEGLRLLVYTNKGTAQALAARLTKKTGVPFEPVDWDPLAGKVRG